CFSIPQKLLKSLFGLVQYAMAQQDIRYYLNGLLMVIEDGQLKLVATDGHRLAYVSREAGGKNLARQEVILPRKTVIELSKLLDDTDEDRKSTRLNSSHQITSYAVFCLKK